MDASCGRILKMGHSKINYQIKRNIYTWITRHPQVMQSPIFNDFIKVIFDDNTEPQMVPKLLLQVSIIEPRNSLVVDPNDSLIKEARDKDDNIIISDSTLRTLLPPQLKTFQHDTKSCVVVNVSYLIKLYIHNLYPGVIVI